MVIPNSKISIEAFFLSNRPTQSPSFNIDIADQQKKRLEISGFKDDLFISRGVKAGNELNRWCSDDPTFYTNLMKENYLFSNGPIHRNEHKDFKHVPHPEEYPIDEEIEYTNFSDISSQHPGSPYFKPQTQPAPPNHLQRQAYPEGGFSGYHHHIYDPYMRPYPSYQHSAQNLGAPGYPPFAQPPYHPLQFGAPSYAPNGVPNPAYGRPNRFQGAGYQMPNPAMPLPQASYYPGHHNGYPEYPSHPYPGNYTGYGYPGPAYHSFAYDPYQNYEDQAQTLPEDGSSRLSDPVSHHTGSAGKSKQPKSKNSDSKPKALASSGQKPKSGQVPVDPHAYDNYTIDHDEQESAIEVNESEMDDSSQKNLNRTNIDKYKSLVDTNASKTLVVKGLDSPSLSNELINSLFSNFGNVTKLVYLKKKSQALVEYPTKELASIARELLNGLSFFGCKMKISFLEKDNLEDGLTDDFKQYVFKPHSKYYRFRAKKSISINPPSKVLHLSNLPKEVYTDDEIVKLFGEKFPVKRVKRLINTVDEPQKMALIELESIDNSLDCIATMHNKIFFGR